MGQLENNILDEATRWFARLQSPELTDVEERQFFAWLKLSDEHQRAYIEIERQWQILGAVENLTTDQSVTQPSAATLVEFPRKPSWIYYPQAIAASVLLLVATFLGILYFNPEDGSYETLVGQQREIRLNDGSQVFLNTGSRLVVNYSDQTRIVSLQEGEAFFSVVTDAARPFIVKTRGGLVRVVGTQFNLQNRSSDTELTVLEGKVAVAPESDFSTLSSATYQPAVTLVADQQVILQPALEIYTPTSVDAAAVTAWRSGSLIYKGESLEQVLLDISRYFDGDIKVGDPSLKELEVAAIFQLQDKKATIQALEATFNFASVEVSENLTLILPKK